MRRRICFALGAGCVVGAPAPSAFSQSRFASRVVEYAPAPGQFVNNPAFNDPTRALGPPVGSGTLAPDSTKVVTLGGFGGAITLAFDRPVADDPRNKLGLDFIVYSNAFWQDGLPYRRTSEAAVVEISRDANADGLANDPWFVVPGSSLPPLPSGAAHAQSWDNDPASPSPPADAAWFPSPAFFPQIGPSFQTTGFLLPTAFDAVTLVHPEGAAATVEAHFGYAELSPTLLLGDRSGADGSLNDNSLQDAEDDPAADPAIFYTTPDDPMTVGVDPGAGGGDAFDIAWAVDALTGEPANLPAFDFIRISAGVDAIRGPLGETSPEIGAVADVRPLEPVADINGSGQVGPVDLAILLAAWRSDHPIADLNESGRVGPVDLAILLSTWRATRDE